MAFLHVEPECSSDIKFECLRWEQITKALRWAEVSVTVSVIQTLGT